MVINAILISIKDVSDVDKNITLPMVIKITVMTAKTCNLGEHENYF